jgi:hypothetical protein
MAETSWPVEEIRSPSFAAQAPEQEVVAVPIVVLEPVALSAARSTGSPVASSPGVEQPAVG